MMKYYKYGLIGIMILTLLCTLSTFPSMSWPIWKKTVLLLWGILPFAILSSSTLKKNQSKNIVIFHITVLSIISILSFFAYLEYFLMGGINILLLQMFLPFYQILVLTILYFILILFQKWAPPSSQGKEEVRAIN